MRVSASGIKTYRACPRKYKIQYVLGYEGTEKAAPLILGSAVHAGLEQIWLGSPVSKALRYVQPYLKELSPKDQIKATAIVEAYHNVYSERIKDEWEVIALEEMFELSMGAKVRGVFDGIIRHRKTGELFILEHKTAANVDTLYWQKLEYDPQLTIYSIAADERYNEKTAVLYDVILKPSVKEGDTHSSVVDMLVRRQSYFFRQRVIRFNLNKTDDNCGEIINTIAIMSRDSIFSRDNQSCNFCSFASVCAGEETLDNTALFQLKRKKEISNDGIPF